MSAEAEIRFELVATGEEAADLGFVGSPTILIDGKDPFVRSVDGFALACRIYQTADGPDGAPTVDQLCAALSALGSTQ